MRILAIIPARGGSKGLSGKNIRLMNGKPLIAYSIDIARGIVDDIDICVSTDDEKIIQIVEEYGLKVPFKRPDRLATDTSTTNDVLLHALDYYESKEQYYDVVLLLQPTSPLRLLKHVKEAISKYNDSIDMVVSVRESHSATVLCQENQFNFLELVINKAGNRRQDIKSYYEYDGSIYVINVLSLKNKGLSSLKKRIKYIIPAKNAIDIDNQLDWDIAEFLMTKELKTN